MSKIIAVAILTALLIGWGPSTVGEADGLTQHTPEQARLVAWAHDRFAGAGLEAPDVTFVFHETLLECEGRVGVYFGDSNTLHMCRLDLHTVLHELGHAWARHNLDEVDRDGFCSLRGLRAWNDHGDPWELRATEHAAEVMAWALMDRDTTVVWVTDDGARTRTLLTIPDSDPASLGAAYRALTGRDPVYRLADAVVAETTVASPEAVRAGS
jgi:hypothetical protein